jgi:hypothetical protein
MQAGAALHFDSTAKHVNVRVLVSQHPSVCAYIYALTQRSCEEAARRPLLKLHRQNRGQK